MSFQKDIFPRQKSTRTEDLRVYNGTKIQTVGKQLSFVVIRENLHPIVGRGSAEAMKMISFDYEQVLGERSASDEDGKCSGGRLCKTVRWKARKVSGRDQTAFERGSSAYMQRSVKIVSASEREPEEDLGHREIRRATQLVNRISIPIKKSGASRICLDPRHLNVHLIGEVYHTKILDEILPDLANAKVFSKFDLADGFWQCELEDESSYLTTFQTPFGRYRFKGLPFGLSVSPEIFYRRLVQILDGLKGVYALADDLPICGRGATRRTQRDHSMLLETMLTCRASQKDVKKSSKGDGIKLNRAKITLRVPNTKFFGSELTENGIQMGMERQKMLANMREFSRYALACGPIHSETLGSRGTPQITMQEGC